MAVRINRSERQVPYLSNVVKGSAMQITPNGVARDQDGTEGSPTGREIGVDLALTMPAPIPVPTAWRGNRSGE